MRMLKSILLAVECRRPDDDVVEAAVRLATAFDSQVSLLHVVEQTHPALELYRIQNAEEHLSELTSRLAKRGVTVARSIVRSGSPAHTIINVAQEHDVDVIAIGAGQQSDSELVSMGSIAEAVVSHAPQPVLAIRPGDPQPLFKKILCPVDQSKASSRGLQNAVRLAKALGSEIFVLSVVPDVSWLTAAVETRVLVDARAEYASEWNQEFAQFVAKADLADVSWTCGVRYGIPHEQIVAAARDFGSDLIIMGATGRTGLVQLLLGSTTRRLLRRLPCSLLTVKQHDVLQELFESDRIAIAQLMEEAESLTDAGEFHSAITKYRLVLTRDPFHAAAMGKLIVLLDKVGDTAEAATFRQRLSRLKAGPERSAVIPAASNRDNKEQGEVS